MSINTVQHERHAGSGQDLVEVVGSFAVATDGTVSSVKGRGFTVVRTSAGLFTITLDRLYPELICGQSTWSGGFFDGGVQDGTYTASTGAYTVRTYDEDAAGVRTNVDPAVAGRINFRLYLTKYSTQVTA
jgi:hypothetical protein